MCIRDSAMMWSTAQVDCGSSAYWSAGVSSCVECPSGTASTGTKCVATVEEESQAIIYYIAVPIGVALLAGVIGLVLFMDCLLYTSDAADDLLCVDLGGRRIIQKKN
eukprot:TRINITY_DN19994_c0_g1_i1.p1 TRINITY_DN19994_c0_g1~~TRINITY_DN19994_c0_g1_i1.p1  ORF type:complete len:107 (-),score=38.15 TRINITY_DN19994_c0_g1_i1:28-348(-)